jgi:undecaprenyl pyrophosphate phosphatase UppP
MATNLIEALPLGIGEGVTEFLPVSSPGHLTIAEGLLGQQVDDPGVTAFTRDHPDRRHPCGDHLLPL